MKIFSFIFSRLKRLFIAVLYQVPWAVGGFILHLYAHQNFADKIKSAFGIDQAQLTLDQSTQSVAFMKNMVSLSNPMASVNYLTSLVKQATAWTRLNSSQMFADVITSFSLWLIDIVLFLGAIYLVWRTIKLYRQKGRQIESAELVFKELKPYLTELQKEIQSLRQEVRELKGKNAESNSTNTVDSRG